MAIGTAAEIGIRIFLDDAASGGLFKINQNMGNIGNSAQNASAKFAAMVQKMVALGVLAGSAISFALFAAALKYSVDQATALQQSMFGLAVATHVPMDVAMQFTNQLMNLAAGSTFSTAEIATGMGILGRAGYSLQAIMGATADGMHGMAAAGVALSIAIRTDAATGFNILSQVMSAYQLPATQAMHTADLLQFAFEHQTSTVAQFGAGLAQVTPIAAQMHIPLSMVTSALDVLGPAMKSTTTAGTALRYMISGMYQPTANGQTAMVALKLATVDASGAFHSVFFDAKGNAVSFTQAIQTLSSHLKGLPQEAQLQYLKDIFSVRGGQGADIQIQQIQKLLGYLGQLKSSSENAGGAMARWQQVMATFGGAMAGLKSSISDLGAAIGMPLLPVLTQAATALNGFISGIRAAAIANPAAAKTFLLLGLAISALGIIIGIVMLAMIPAFAPFFILAGVIIGVIAVIALLTVGITLLVTHFGQISAAFHSVLTSATPLGAILRGIGSFMSMLGGIARDLGNFLAGQFAQTWTTIKQAMAPLGPVFAQLGAIFQHFLPMLKAVAQVIGFLLLAALTGLGVVLGVVVVGALHGVVQAITVFIGGLAHIISGVIQVVAGIITVFYGFFTILHGIFTLNGNEIKQGFLTVWNGIRMIISGVLQAIMGIFIAVFGTIIGFVAGFVHGVISFFQWLGNMLTGHSIIPDMMNAMKNIIMGALNAIVSFIAGIVLRIVNWFLQMGQQIISHVTSAWNQFRSVVSAAFNLVLSIISGAVSRIISFIINLGSGIVSHVQNAMSSARNAVSSGINGVVNFFAGLPGRVMGALSGLAGMLANAGSNMIHALANGITGAIGSVVGAVGNVVSFIAGHLPHSPAKMGPLVGMENWMPNMMKMMASGIESGAPNITSAMGRALGGMSSVPGMTRMTSPTSASGGMAGGGGVTVMPVNIDGKMLFEIVMNRMTGQLQLNGAGRSFR